VFLLELSDMSTNLKTQNSEAPYPTSSDVSVFFLDFPTTIGAERLIRRSWNMKGWLRYIRRLINYFRYLIANNYLILCTECVKFSCIKFLKCITSPKNVDTGGLLWKQCLILLNLETAILIQNGCISPTFEK